MGAECSGVEDGETRRAMAGGTSSAVLRGRQTSSLEEISNSPSSLSSAQRETLASQEAGGVSSGEKQTLGADAAAGDKQTATAATHGGSCAGPSLVANTLRRTAPFGFVDSQDWRPPQKAAHFAFEWRLPDTAGCNGRRAFQKRIQPPVLHSLRRALEETLATRRACAPQSQSGVASGGRAGETSSGVREVEVPTYARLLYEALALQSASEGGERAAVPGSSRDVGRELVRLVALQRAEEGGDAQSQGLNDRGEADLSQIKTGEDAVAFFARHGSTTKTKFLYCNRAETDALSFEPYKLAVVPAELANPEHFTISATGVVHICPGKPSECLSQHEWIQQAFVHSVLRSLSFFKTFIARKALVLWAHASRQQVFEQRRRRLAQTLFLAKPLYCQHLQTLHRTLSSMRSVQLLDVQPSLYDLAVFAANQQATRTDPKTGAHKQLEVKALKKVEKPGRGALLRGRRPSAWCVFAAETGPRPCQSP